MNNTDDLKHLYTDSEINLNVLKEILEENKIASLIRNDMNSGLSAGFGGGYMEAQASLFVTIEHFAKAKELLEEFTKSME